MKKPTYLLSLDQGTSSSRALIVDEAGQCLAVSSVPLESKFPQPGWVEQEAVEIWQSQHEAIQLVIKKLGIKMTQITGIGITNQRETTILWDRKTGEPVAPAIVWQDRRTSDFCQEHREQWQTMVVERTGLRLDPYFSATKLHYLLQDPSLKGRSEAGELAFGTVDTWLLWKLSGGKLHMTDPSNASRTMLMNIETGQWDQVLLDWLEIPRSLLPEIQGHGEVLGLSSEEVLGAEIPIAAQLGDQQASLFAQGCHRAGEAKNTYGTGCFLLANTGTRRVRSKNRLLTTVAWQFGEEITYALEGSLFTAGAAVQWLHEGLGLIDSPAEVEMEARKVADSGGVSLVPAFSGLGAPHWDPSARALIGGLTRGSGKAEICRAALEGIALQSRDLIQAFEQDLGAPIDALKVDGGGTQNRLLMQIQADLAELEIQCPSEVEQTALGAAYMAGLALGVWRSMDEIANLQSDFECYRPEMKSGPRNEIVSRWGLAVERCLAWEA